MSTSFTESALQLKLCTESVEVEMYRYKSCSHNEPWNKPLLCIADFMLCFE